MRRWVAIASSACLLGCGAYYPPAPGSSPPRIILTDSATAPAQGPDAGAPTEYDLAGRILQVGGGSSYVIAATDQGAVRVAGSDPPESMAYVLDDGGDQSVGAITALVLRIPPPSDPSNPAPTSGLLALMPQGLAIDFTDYFEPAGLSLSAPASVASALDDVGSGDDEVVWVGVPGGAERIRNNRSDTFVISGQSSAPTAVLQLDDALTLVAFGGTVYALAPSGPTAVALNHDFGDVHGMVRGAATDTAFLATSEGLLARDGQGAFTRYLSGTNVQAVSYDAINGLYFTTDAALLCLRNDGSLEALATLPSAGAHPLAVDGFGDVWVGSGSTLLEYTVGAPVAT